MREFVCDLDFDCEGGDREGSGVSVASAEASL